MKDGKEEAREEQRTTRSPTSMVRLTGRDEETRREQEGTRSPTLIVRLTGRDKELLAHVATARYLTLPQLKRIVFARSLAGKGGTVPSLSANEGPSDIVCRRRLMRLCDARPA